MNTELELCRYGAVVRSAGAYVPPGARKAGTATSGPSTPAAIPTKPEIPKVQVNGPDGVIPKDGQKPASPAPGSSAANVVCCLCITLISSF